MKDEGKTKEQLVKELREIRRRVDKLEKLEADYRRAEEEIKNFAERQKILFEYAPDAYYLNNLKGVFVDGNRAAEEITGYKREELIGKSFLKLNLLPISEIPRAAKLLAVNALGKPTGPDDFTLNRKDGGQVVVEIRTYPVNIEGEKLVLGIARDVTERKQAQEVLQKAHQELEIRVKERTAELTRANEELRTEITDRKRAENALRSSEEKYRSLVNNINLGIFRSTPDLNGRFLEVNPAMETITGYSREELLSIDIVDLYKNPQEREAILKELEVSRKQVTKEPRFIKKDGSEIIVSDTKSPVRNRAGEIMFFDGILEDITLRKTLEEERQKIDKLESLGVLAGGIAHDFNNLLTGIMGNISMAMMEVKESSDIYISLQEADKASERARELTQQLLTFSRGGAPIKKMTSLASLIKDNTDFVIRGSGIIAEYIIPEDLWLVDADSGQISQVITNIVINARDVMPGGGTIRAKACNKTVRESSNLPLNPGKYIEIAISDTGIGIQEKFLNSIFDPYFTTKQKGSGLGLATSYSIIKNHNGCIKVESELGVGTTFTIYLPASDKKAEINKEKVTENKTEVNGGRILVMDDEETIRVLLSRILSGLGYEVETTSDGDEAVQAYIKARGEGRLFDAVILDITVPGGMGGVETIKALLEIDPEVKAVVSSGYATDPIMSEYKEYGFKAVVNKPYKAAQMEETLQELLIV